jgi:hypothetical protein
MAGDRRTDKDLERSGRGLRSYSGILPGGTKDNHENLSHESRCPVFLGTHTHTYIHALMFYIYAYQNEILATARFSIPEMRQIG